MPRLALLLVALAAAVALLFALGVFDSPPAPNRDAPSVPRSEALQGRPVLQGRGALPTAADAPPPSPAPPTAESEEKAPLPAGARYVLRGRLEGFDPRDGGVADIEVVGLGRSWARPTEGHVGRSDTDGSFQVDVSALLKAHPDASEFEIRVDHPLSVAATTRVEVRAGWDEDDSAPVVHEVRIELVRASVVAGRVEDDAGRPVPTAKVALYRLGPDGPETSQVAAASTDEKEGTYRLKATGVGRCVLVAASKGLRPATVEIDVEKGLHVSPAPLVLRPGAFIEGRVVFRGRPAEGATLEVTSTVRDRTVSVGGSRLGWTGDGFEYVEASAKANADGRYIVLGLMPGRWDLEVDDLPGWVVTNTFGRATKIEVDAPTRKADIDLVGATLELEVQRRGKRVGPVTLLVQTPGTTHIMTLGEAGRLSVLTAPEERFEVSVMDEAYEPTALELVAPAEGEHRSEVLELRDRKPRSTLQVRLTDSSGAPVAKAGFALYLGDVPDLFPAKSWDRDATDGVFVLPDSPSGRALLYVRAGGSWRGGDAHYLEKTAKVIVPEGGTVELAFEVELGGRLRVRARGKKGVGLAAACTIRDEKGNAMEVEFVAREENSFSIGDVLDESVPSNVEPALPAGTYEVEITAEGYRSKTVEVVVKKGETTNLDVTLE